MSEINNDFIIVASTDQDINLEKVKNLVAGINAKYSILQQRCISQSQHSSGKDESTSFDMRFPGPFGVSSEFVIPNSSGDSTTQPPACKQRGRFYWNERELYVAASELCMYLNGGINYRNLCMQYQSMFELLLTMLKEDIKLARQTDFLPGGMLEKAHKVFSGLLQESKKLLVENGVIPKTTLPPPQETKKSRRSSEEKRGSKAEYALPIALPRRGSQDGNYKMHDGLTDRQISTSELQSKTGEKKSGSHVKIDIQPKAPEEEVVYSPLAMNSVGVRTVNEDSYDVSASKITQKEEDTMLPPRNHNNHNSTPPPSAAGGGGGGGKIPVNSSSNKKKGKRMTNSSNATRYHCMEELYDELYQNEGIDMLNETLQLVFLKEYNKTTNASGEVSFSKFKEHLEKQLFPCLQSYETLISCTHAQVSLRSEYMANCLQQHVKPSEHLLDFLFCMDKDRGATSVVLENMQLNDTDMRPFIPLFSRMQRLRFLDISHNDIHDKCIQELCTSLERHASIEVIDVSDNPLTDVAGAALIQLAVTTPQLKAVGQHQIPFSPHVREALGHELQKNRNAHGTVWAPPRMFNGISRANRGETMTTSKRSTGARLVPMALKEDSRSVSPGTQSTVSQSNESLVSRSMGFLRIVRLPQLTAKRGGTSNAHQRESQSSPR